jgi:cardiolipin synthase A/B
MSSPGLELATVVAILGQMSSDKLNALASLFERTGGSVSNINRIDLNACLQDQPETICSSVDQAIELAGAIDGLTASEFAISLRAVGNAYSTGINRERVSIAWTGPECVGSVARSTSAAWMDLVNQSKEHLWIASYATYPDDEMNSAIESALARGVQVNILIERSEDGLDFNGNLDHVSDKIKSDANFYAWPAEKRPNAGNPSMHLKCIVADNDSVFLTSANLTGAAHDRNMEAGFIVRGGNQATWLCQRFESMISNGDLIKISAS